MKLLKLFFPALAILALAQGCTKEYITNYNGAKVYARDYTVTPQDWTYNYADGNEVARDDNYLWAEFDNPDITQNVVDNGTVQAFIYTEVGDIKTWNPLPFVYPLHIVKTDKTTGTVIDDYIIGENTRFDYNVGKVTFIIQDLDGINPEEIVNSMSIKVCVTI